MPEARSPVTLSSVELTRLLQQLEDVLGKAGRLREQIARRLARTPGRQASRVIAARKASVRTRR